MSQPTQQKNVLLKANVTISQLTSAEKQLSD